LQSVKESFILGGFSFVRLRYLTEKFILLSCEEDGIIGKLIEDNKEWFDGMFDSNPQYNRLTISLTNSATNHSTAKILYLYFNIHSTYYPYSIKGAQYNLK